ncbi:amino acid ABC transporter permease [Sciscionella sediminilitoris]|uniref:amino acid ABC transporter permease n=1 Tax=Sciscionella sediminilitoris TaxID=1445613 RepID=UPI0005687307|nr:amino acid ABC transporter permease [Sciscionella sp. SE31]
MSASVLTDLPGPKARARHALYGVIGTIVILGILGFVIYRLAASGQFDPELWSWLEYQQIQLGILSALLTTLEAFAVGAVLALVFGALLAAGRLSEHRWVRIPASFIVELFRAIPLLVLMFMFYFGFNSFGAGFSPFVAVVVSLMLYNGSVLAEIFRAGILAVPHGQSEAAYALGMRKTRVMLLILLPQALRAMLPTIISQLVVLLKDTALGSLVLFQELLYYFRQAIGGQLEFGQPAVPSAISVAAIYVVMCLLLSWLATYLEKRNRRSKKRVVLEGPEAEQVEQIALASGTEVSGGIQHDKKQ